MSKAKKKPETPKSMAEVDQVFKSPGGESFHVRPSTVEGIEDWGEDGSCVLRVGGHRIPAMMSAAGAKRVLSEASGRDIPLIDSAPKLP